MADTISTSYQISAGTLGAMKAAAGNYLPSYGSWRYKIKQPEPPVEKEKDPVLDEPEKLVDDPIENITTPPPEENQTEKKSGEASQTWGSEAKEPVVVEGDGGQTYRESWDKMSPSDKQKKGGSFEAYVAKAKQWWKDHPDKYEEYQRKKLGYTAAGKDDDRGGVDTTFDYDADGEKVNIQETTWGDQTSRPPVKKRSPMRSQGESQAPMAIGPGGFQDLYANVDAELDAATNNVVSRKSIASKALHQQMEGLVKEVAMQYPGNKQAAGTALNSYSTSLQEMVNPETGALSTFIEAKNENLISESITPQEKHIMSKLIQMDSDVEIGVDPHDNLIYKVPGVNGEVIPMTAVDVKDITKKRIAAFSLGKQFTEAAPDLYNMGRSGLEWDGDSVLMKNRSLLKDPDRLASVMLDPGIFTSEPLIDKVGEMYPEVAAVNSRELIRVALETEEGEGWLRDLGAHAIGEFAYERYKVGRDVYEKENKGAPTELSAAELIEKYA